MSELSARFDLPLHTGSPGAARRAVREMLAGWGFDDPDWVERTVLVVSELVSNALVHGGGCVGVDVQAHDDVVVIGVADGSAVLPRRRDGDDAGGRGLLIIDAFTDAWGTEDHQGGKRVWVRLPPHPRPATGAA
ncbi:MAG TPA: ATP-binding protein [Pilimelia sp.]|nr:ATP-binding protein [Pilimelia sp.]